ncbi:Hypothetical predicted protein [Olea europaea subsp. europaea]|uniref:Uncharacterized protein n=1 Tax=Olea europaea subsp. europaea TaxID=158383 RepID=A0A8S0UZT5_OLEEU|nr:Hypothetical predicted protein [Olea europaea subsp. europaea]
MCEYKISVHRMYDSTESYTCENCKTVHFFKCEFYIYRDEVDTEYAIKRSCITCLRAANYDYPERQYSDDGDQDASSYK